LFYSYKVIHFHLLNLIVLPAVDSTNSYALRLVEEGLAPEGTAVLAWEQTSGRGQRGSVWNSQHGLGLYFSLILTPPPGRLTDISGLIKSLALAVLDYLEQHDIPVPLSIKWPNDILAGDRKICGILMESVIKGDRLAAVVFGAGINLNHTGFSGHYDRLPVSVHMLTGKSYDPEKEAAEFYPELMKRYRAWLSQPPYAVSSEYNKHLYGRNEQCRFLKDGEIFTARLVEVNDQGMAVIEREGTITSYPHPALRFLDSAIL
jgi:BirA family biotin operon repressor/biotin-[acetyl-CoA-carboxylase] ligase